MYIYIYYYYYYYYYHNYYCYYDSYCYFCYYYLYYYIWRVYIYIFRGLYANPHNFSMVCACPICFKSRRRALDSEPCKYALKRPGALLNGTCPSWMGTCPEIVRKWARTLIEPFDIYIYTHILLLLILLQYYYYYHYYYYHYYYYNYICVCACLILAWISWEIHHLGI